MSEAAAVTLAIDGIETACEAGESVLNVLRRIGTDVPTLCFDPALPAEGGCRMCLVEEARSGRLIAACHTPAVEGMVIRTNSPKIERIRRGILSLTLAEHAQERFAPARNGSEFENVFARVGSTGGIHREIVAVKPVDSSHPYLRFDSSLCIVCRRCLHACQSVQGQFVYGIEGRGAGSHLVYGPSTEFAASDCVACGACVTHCPTGAITDRDRIESPAVDATTRSTCGYCGVGCQIEVAVSGDRVVSIDGAQDAVVNHGHLCSKGRYAHAYQRSHDRLRTPLVRKDGQLCEVSWAEACRFIAERMNAIKLAHGPDAIGGLASSRSTNEAAYLLQKFMRAVVGTNNVDCCARVCHSSTALALQTVTGTGAASASYADIEKAGCIVLAGANPTEAHPIVGARIKQAALRGVPLIVIDPRRVELAEYARVHLQIEPGTNVPCFNAIAKLLIDHGRIDQAYVDDRTEGFDGLAAFFAGNSVESFCAAADVEPALVEQAARILSDSGPALFVHGLGLSELTQGVESVMALCNLGMLTGSIGKRGSGMLPLRGQNNVQGAADMGAAPGFATGYQPVSDPAVRERLSQRWGAPLPASPGLTTPEMLDAADEGRLRGLWAVGEDLAHSDPYEVRTLRALKNLDLLIVQDMFFCETAKYAHVVLPVASTLENDGTYTNGERRIQRVRPAVAAPGDARPDWRVIRDVANACGAGWRYESPAEIMVEIGEAAPKLFGGVRFERLEGDGLQWPCPSVDHPGTSTVHAGGFLRGKGLLSAIAYRPSPEMPTDEFPLLLITGRVLHQYNVGTMTQRTPNRELAPDDQLELHEDDAARLGIADRAVVTSQWGQTTVPARVSGRVARGSCFLSFHYASSHTNRLVGPHVDPKSQCPEYKRVAVRVEAAVS